MKKVNLGRVAIVSISFFEAGWLWYWANAFAFEQTEWADRVMMFGLNNIIWLLGMMLLWCFLSSLTPSEGEG